MGWIYHVVAKIANIIEKKGMNWPSDHIVVLFRGWTRELVGGEKNGVSCYNIAVCYDLFEPCRDLKPQNLLLDKKNGLLKIGDLGLSRAFTVPMKSYTHEVKNKYAYVYGGSNQWLKWIGRYGLTAIKQFRLLLCGIEHQKFCLGLLITQSRWIFGLLDAFLVTFFFIISLFLLLEFNACLCNLYRFE